MNPGPEAAQARRIFGDALDCPPEERAALLDAACGGNESLRRELESLLRLHPAAGRFFDRAVPPTVHSGSTLPDQFEGVTIGAYRILDEVATGGMGSVYRAERTDQAFQKMVAIKLIRAGLLSPDAVARFKTERQVLADLEHPGIARLLDGGSTADGMPFLVMEFVDGVPLNRHVAERNPGLAERISLFLEICEAVQYAHQNLVVHRDLKPGNILVDVHGHVKLLDFGIAKVLAPSDANAGQTVAHAFTVRYASPEQVRGGRITTATDIYSLGVILYEMLCGVLPYDLDGVSPASVVDTITTREPEKPSRRADPVIARRLAGDLDMIILKALHKEPERRYATVDELAADLKRQRRGEPVLARPDTAAYRISRFVGRNRGLVAGTLGMIVVLIAALLATLNAYRNAAVSRNNAEFETYIASLAAAEASIVTEKVSEASQHLGKAPPALRGWEWGHLEARLDRSLASFPAHHAGITSLAVAGDGTIAATSVDSTVAILSAEGKVLERHGPFDSAVETARFIDGDRAFVAGLLDGSVIRVERNTGAVRTLFPAGREWAFVSVSPDQRLLAAGFVDGTACVLSLADNRIVREWQAHGVLTVVAYSPDGRYLATAGAEGNVTIHDAKTLAQDSTFPAHARRVYSLAWSLDATRLATGSIDRTARVWQVPDGRLVTTFSEHHGTVAALAFDPSGGRILSTGSDNRLFLWNAATGAILSSFRGHESDVSAIAAGAGPDVVLTGDWGGVIRRWTWRTEDVRTLGYPHTQFEISALNQAAVDPLEEHIACATSVRDAPVWSFDAPLPERLIPLEAGRCMAYTPDGAFLIAGTDKGSVRLIRAADGTTLRSIGAHDGPVFGMALNPSGDLVATTSGDSLIRFWTVPALKPADSIAAGINLRGLAFSPSGDLLAGAGTDGAVRLWSTLPTRLVERIASPSPRLTALAFDSSGQRFAAAGSDGALYLIDPATKRVTLIREAGPAPLTSVAWSRDGTRIAAGALDETVRLFDPEKRREVLSLHGHAGKVTSVLFLRNDRALISTSTDGTVRIWEAGVTGRRGNASETAGLQ